MQTLCKYILLQIPAAMLLALVLLLVDHWVDISDLVLWGIIGGWLAKDALLYPLVWRAYAPHSEGERNTLVGATGITRQPLCPTGYIEIRGELWRAQLAHEQAPLAVGQRVVVRKINGLTLIVEAAADQEEIPRWGPKLD